MHTAALSLRAQAWPRSSMSAADHPPPPPPRSSARNNKRSNRKAPPPADEQEVFADAVAPDDAEQAESREAPQVADPSATMVNESEVQDTAERADESMSAVPTPAEPTEEPVGAAPATAEPADAALQAQLASRDQELALLRKELQDAISVRNDVADAHADWLKEREELRGQKEELEQRLEQEREERNAQREELERRLEQERERADSAEERIRDLRRTNEESRRAIMRLQQARPATPRTESDASERSARRTSAILGPFTAKTLSSAVEGDSEPEHKGLRDLQLVSPPQANSDTFSPVLGSKIEEEETDEAPAARDNAEEGSQQSGITGLFPSSLLRPPFHLLRKSGGAESQTGPSIGSQDDGAMLESLRTEHEKAQSQLASMHTEIAALQDQLLESREAQQASESLIKSLREYIVNAEKSGKREVPPTPSSAASAEAAMAPAASAEGASSAELAEAQAETEAEPPQST